MLYIKNALVHGQWMDLELDEGKIRTLIPVQSDNRPDPETNDSSSVEVLDLKGLKLYPGLIDIHSHGNSGHDTMEGNFLSVLSEYELAHGVTSWCPTTMTMPVEELKKVCEEDLSQVRGAHILGFHLEGPFISSKYKGAQKEENIIDPDWNLISCFPNLSLITLAPELPGSLDFIRKSRQSLKPPVICLGHTDTDYETAVEAFDCGAQCVTHMMNAMPALHHRKPGLFGAAVKTHAYIQVICDGVHIHPVVIEILYRLFGSGRMVLISDSMEAAGMKDGSYTLGGQKVIVADGEARMEDGTLAGSTTVLYDMVRHAIDFGIPEEEAFRMASGTPAELLGIQDHKGFIAPEQDADLIAVDDQLHLKHVILSGKLIF